MNSDLPPIKILDDLCNDLALQGHDTITRRDNNPETNEHLDKLVHNIHLGQHLKQVLDHVLELTRPKRGIIVIPRIKMQQRGVCRRCVEAAEVNLGVLCRFHRDRTPLADILRNADAMEMSRLLRGDFSSDHMDQIRLAAVERMANPPKKPEPEPSSRNPSLLWIAWCSRR